MLAGILKAIKIIDDRLLQPESATQAYEDTWKVMMEVVKKNFRFSEDKFLFGPNAKFAGLDLAPNPTGLFTIKPERKSCLLYTSPSPRDGLLSRMPSSA